MLAEYPAVVDFDFSPIPSPLFGKDDTFLPCYHGDHETEVPLSRGFDPTLLNEEEDDVSSISASIQCSDTLEENEDLPYHLVDSSYPDTVIGPSTSQDSPIHGQGVDVNDEIEGLFGSVDFLNSSYLDLAQEPVSLDVPNVLQPVEEDFDLGCLEEVHEENCNSGGSKVADHGIPSTSSTSGKRKRKKKMEDKGWGEMDGDEKEEVAEHLSSVLRSLLGPRERLEVMSLISQDLVNERNLVIEPHMLSESTLAKLETYLEEQEMTGEASDSEIISEPERMRSYGNATKRKCSSLPASPQHRGSFSERSPSLGVKKQSGQQKSLRGWKRRTRKDYRQASKERRSGLFHKEEVISLSTSIGEEEESGEEIDILA
ncbi:protein FAM199X-like isoform X1 [Lytechinus variegatus]|uniref:protein FAM199X-like isoform X1 n=1 Tax=Lytechinus variegatus TaxID=7654 RepID=UPI001BB2CBC4|nr:protein FAM199X-like isoform X1 [Lytechinus variegatus]